MLVQRRFLSHPDAPHIVAAAGVDAFIQQGNLPVLIGGGELFVLTNELAFLAVFGAGHQGFFITVPDGFKDQSSEFTGAVRFVPFNLRGVDHPDALQLCRGVKGAALRHGFLPEAIGSAEAVQRDAFGSCGAAPAGSISAVLRVKMERAVFCTGPGHVLLVAVADQPQFVLNLADTGGAVRPEGQVGQQVVALRYILPQIALALISHPVAVTGECDRLHRLRICGGSRICGNLRFFRCAAAGFRRSWICSRRVLRGSGIHHRRILRCIFRRLLRPAGDQRKEKKHREKKCKIFLHRFPLLFPQNLPLVPPKPPELLLRVPLSEDSSLRFRRTSVEWVNWS